MESKNKVQEKVPQRKILGHDEYLAKIDLNNTLENKTASESYNILKSEIDCVVDKLVPLKKHGNRSKKKHLSKESIRNIKY